MRTQFTLETWQGPKASDSETQTQGLRVTDYKEEGVAGSFDLGVCGFAWTSRMDKESP